MRYFILYGFFILLFTITCLPQEKLILTMEKAIEIALEQNERIKLAQDDISFSESQIDEAKSTIFPKIDGFADYTHNFKNPVFFSNIAPEPIVIGNDNVLVLGLTLVQPVWLGGKLMAANDIADLLLQSSKENLQFQEDNIVLDVTKTFYTVLLTKEAVRVAEETYASVKSTYENISQLKLQGMASEFDSLRAKVTVKNVEPAVINTSNQLKIVKNALKMLLNIDINSEIEIVGTLDYVPLDSLTNYQKIALEYSPQLESLTLQKGIAENLKTIEFSNYWPSVFANGQINNISSSNDLTVSANENVTTISAGLTVALPIFNGFGTAAKVEQAEINISRVTRGIALLTQKIQFDVESAFLNMQEAEKRIIAQKDAVSAAQRSLEIAKVRYNNGLSTLVELNDTELALVNTKLEELRALYDFLTAKADFDKLIGTINQGY